MRVLLLNSYFAPNLLGGSERSVQTLAEALHQRGHDVIVVSLSTNQQDGYGSVNGVRVHYLADGNFGRSTADPRRGPLDRMLWHLSGEFIARNTAGIRRLLQSERPDIVHTNTLGGMSCGAIWRAAQDAGVPVVHTVRDYHLLCARGVMFRSGRDCGTTCLDCSVIAMRRRAASARVNAVVGISVFILERHLRAGYFPNSRVRQVIFNGFQPRARNSDAVEPEVRPGGPLRIGYLGRLHPTKGIERLLVAVERVAGVVLEVAGSGPEDYVGRLYTSTRCERVNFSGHVEPEEFFRRIDLLVVPSQWAEPFGRVIIEAFAFGVPVLAAARGGITEIVEEDRNGWLFDPDDAYGLEVKLRAVAADRSLLGSLRGNCLRTAGMFLPERMVGAYEAVYAAVRGEAR